VTVGIWVVAAVLVGGVLGAKLGSVSSALSQSVDSLAADSPSVQIADLQRDRFASGQTYKGLLVYRRLGGLTAADKAQITRDAQTVARVPGTGRVIPPYAPNSPPELRSANGQVAITLVPLTQRLSSGRDKAIKTIRRLTGNGGAGLQVDLTGPAAYQSDLNTAIMGASGGLLLATGVLVLLLLLAIYRSPLVALIPLVVVGVSYSVALGLIYVYARATGTTIDRTAQSLLAVLMFGAGTDYCLLLVARYSTELRSTADPHVAMGAALRRTLPAIVSSGVTVAAAMLTFYAATLRADRVLAPVNAIGILVVMVAGVTLLPALMTILGRRGFWPSGRTVAQQTKAAAGAGTGSAIGRRPGLWLRIGGLVQAHPGPALGLSLLVLAAGAVGLVTFTEKVSILNDFRVSTDATRGLALLSSGYPQGAVFPETVLVRRAGAPLTPADIQAARVRASSSPGVADVSAVDNTSRDRTMATFTVVYAGDPFTKQALARAAALRTTMASPAPGLSGLVGDGTSARLDYKNAVNHDTRVIVPLVLAIILLMLIVLLRALVAPLYLLTTVVISFLGSIGLSVLIIEKVLGQDPDAFYPLICFVFLVALGVDYNIFLMSRVREEAAEGGTRKGMLRALVATGPVITSAGLILAGTFAALTPLPLWILAEIGLTVALGVLIDTFLVRTVAVPALVTLFGERSWWPSSATANAPPARPRSRGGPAGEPGGS
jgi:RND superfamily putative drug exporter